MKRIKKMINKPSESEIDSYLKKWDSLENYVLQESSLKKLFFHTYPLNIEMDDVLIKVCSLNDFYSTNIFSPFSTRSPPPTPATATARGAILGGGG